LFQRKAERVKKSVLKLKGGMDMENITKHEDSKKTYNNEDLKTTVPEHERKDAKEDAKPLSKVMNGSMATTMDEIKQLGKDMEGMKTGKDLKEEGLETDPIQEESQK
jgi:hypothetical protein